MKKIISMFIFLLLLVGCSLSNTPTAQVEELLSKYQMLDSDINSGINDVVMGESLTSEQQDRYRKIIEKQYKNLMYEVKDEEIDGNNAEITVEIEVMDYKKIVNEINSSYQGQNNFTVESYNNAKLDALEKAKDKVTYTIEFDVIKDKDGNWKLTSLDNETIKKIQGMY